MEKLMELKISHFLRFGVIVCAIVMLLGWLLSSPGSDPFIHLSHYQHVSLVTRLQTATTGVLLSYSGLALLISLPVMRVFLCSLLFLRQKESIMAAIGFIVLIGLMMSFVLGFRT
jgi:uncharacterized membrane protein